MIGKYNVDRQPSQQLYLLHDLVKSVAMRVRAKARGVKALSIARCSNQPLSAAVREKLSQSSSILGLKRTNIDLSLNALS